MNLYLSVGYWMACRESRWNWGWTKMMIWK